MDNNRNRITESMIENLAKRMRCKRMLRRGLALLSALVLAEDTAFSQRVEAFTVWALCGGDRVRRVAEGTTIGRKKIVRFSRPVQTEGLLVTFDRARGVPAIALCEAWRRKSRENKTNRE